MVSNEMMKFMYDTWGHLLTSFDRQWLSPENFEIFCQPIHVKGGPLQNCFGFVDSTARKVCRPGRH